MLRNRYSIAELETHAQQLRRQVVNMVAKTGMGYLQQGLGAADLFTALYMAEMSLDESNPAWPDRDRLILSTAHNTAVFYAAMAMRGLIPAQSLETYTVDGSPLEVNASERVGPLVEATCGSLGQGLSVAVGMALSLRRQGRSSRVYVILGDGELQEGQVWEAAMSAADKNLDNLCLIIDRNFMQVEGHTDKVLKMEPLVDKWTAFGWRTSEINGNEISEVLAGLDQARATRGQPTCLIAHTIAGRGVPFLEHRLAHMAAITKDEAKRALELLGDPA